MGISCNLSHAIHLVLPDGCLTKAANDYPDIPLPQSATDVEADFQTRAESGVFVLLADRQADGIRVSFCTPRYELVCSLTAEQDAYAAIRLTPLSLRTHNLIARGAMRVMPQAWHVYANLEALADAPTRESGLPAMLAAWTEQGQAAQNALQVQDSSLSAAQMTFLANVDTLIDLACQVDLEKASRQERVPVKGVEPALLVRSSGNAYRFRLNAPAPFRVGELLRAGSGTAGYNGPGYDGVVAESAGNSIVLRFHQPVDLSSIKKMEWLLPRKSTKQYAIQHAAVNALRNRDALNQRLLPLIVENRFETYDAPALEYGDDERANPAQKIMIERALSVPDLLLALGPPGTGKTNTICEIVTRQAALGKKVLVTSKNNKAVDNVLMGLGNVQALRIGREDAVDPEVRPLLIDNIAEATQQKIMNGIEPVQDMLDEIQMSWPQIQYVLERLGTLAVGWRLAISALEREQANLESWQKNSHKRIEPVLERQEARFRMLSVRATQAARRAENLRRRIESFQQWSRIPLLGAVFVFIADQLGRNWQKAFEQYHLMVQNIRRSRENAKRIWDSYEHFATASERALRRKRAVMQAEETLTEVNIEVTQTLMQLSRLSQNLGALSGVPAVQEKFLFPAALEASLPAWRRWYELMMCRRGLLMEWRDALQTSHTPLYPALIRRADVVAATCIGIATDLRFEDLEFDLVIADEAGQIQVMDLLVPLVRARRAVLVGDHLQLPPVVEPEITEKIRQSEPDNRELGEWLEKSLFERLIERSATPDDNKVMLDLQYRMPRQIAEFISEQFYGGNYHTGNEIFHTDSFFTNTPMVFVDTLHEEKRFEQRAEDGQGYFNLLEARLIADLVLAYHFKNTEAGVIVPYKKQAETIRRELRRRQPGMTEDDLISRVATVDSFQGKEQDVIIFGFTRSNREGRIGFLTELRRLNVSLTRARRQLVLLGDSTTLTHTPDQDFARLMKSLLLTIQANPKGYIHASELAQRIQS